VSNTSSSPAWIAVLAFGLFGTAVRAQTEYYNLDSGRPTRVEDATPSELGELEVQFLPLRGERLGDGTERFRLEPKIAYGILARTEFELRVPLMDVRAPNARETVGVASIAVGALHAFNIETGATPAFAVAGELVAPAGSLSAPTGSYSLKGLLTKTFPLGRVHVNVGGGTWSVRLPMPSPAGGTVCGNAPGVPPCTIPDVPCDIVPASPAASRIAPRFFCAAPATLTTSLVSAVPPPTGAHWTAGIGLDHTWPMISTVMTADVVVDRFAGLYPLNDWTAEVGVRHQLTPQLIADVGVGRRFAGTTQSTSVVFGMSYSAPLRALIH
jgi:hypothetical protein